MSQTSVSSQSTWRSKIKAMGPGILMASAAVGGSHIVSSTQAGGQSGHPRPLEGDRSRV